MKYELIKYGKYNRTSESKTENLVLIIVTPFFNCEWMILQVYLFFTCEIINTDLKWIHSPSFAPEQKNSIDTISKLGDSLPIYHGRSIFHFAEMMLQMSIAHFVPRTFLIPLGYLRNPLFKFATSLISFEYLRSRWALGPSSTSSLTVWHEFVLITTLESLLSIPRGECS